MQIFALLPSRDLSYASHSWLNQQDSIVPLRVSSFDFLFYACICHGYSAAMRSSP
ncbi:hypothetical protein B0J17DRAFT_653450 [Rhizoctonia solani]|nr:hypothetical protein B0J17DRAFT_653450 [Rhizoctonia solani]